MILQNKLNTLTEDEQMVLLYAVNAALTEGTVYQYSDIKLLKPTWLRVILPAAKRLIKPEHVNLVESLEKKLL